MGVHAEKQRRPQQQAAFYGSRRTRPTVEYRPSASMGFAHDLSGVPPYFGLAGALHEGTMAGNGGPATTSLIEKVNATATGTPKLTKKPVGELLTYECGGFRYDIRWQLDKPTSAGGLIVQKVEWNYDVKDCDGKNVDMKKFKWYRDVTKPYWEAWVVRPGQSVTTLAEKGVPMDDRFSSGSPGTNTKGIISVVGMPEFFEGMKLPSDFKVTPNSPAGAAPMTWTAPKLTGGSGTILHSFTAPEWDCCQSPSIKTPAPRDTAK